MTEVRCWRDQAACLDVVSADYDPFFAETAGLEGNGERSSGRERQAERGGDFSDAPPTY
jgi:hypothetical protein